MLLRQRGPNPFDFDGGPDAHSSEAAWLDRTAAPPRARNRAGPYGRDPYAVRKPKQYAVSAPGDLVQVDTLNVRPVPEA